MPSRNLPARPNLAQYKKQAKDLLKACHTDDADALQRVRDAHPRPPGHLTLADAQLVIAREHGDSSWPAFAARVETAAVSASPATVWRQAERAVIAGDVARLEHLLAAHGQLLREGRPPASTPGGLAPEYGPDLDARTIIARNHHCADWEGFASLQQALRTRASSVANFEAAVDAVVAGDVASLERLLREHRELVRARSVRSHRSTLLHYVGANGVEYFRQRTPRNAPDVARQLLDAGADVESTADVYGGGATTLGLVATSITPVIAGVLVPLLEVLLDRGAVIDTPGTRSIVNDCLRNGRPQAAAFLASRGAPLDLEGAAGVGRLDRVRACFDADGALRSPATREQMTDGFAWACEFGRTAVVEELLDRGMDVAVRVKHHGQTGLHWAAGGGHLETVMVLLRRGAPVDATDETWEATPLQWAFFGLTNAVTPPAESDRYYAVIAALVGTGAPVRREWLEDARERNDDKLIAALRP